MDVKTYIAVAYSIFFNGEGDTSNVSVKGILEKYNFKEGTINYILGLVRSQERNSQSEKYEYLKNYDFDYYFYPKYTPFEGHQNLLGYYYRHLYQIVKYVENEKLLTNKEVKNYMKMIKSQMTNFEQIMLFLNSFYIHGQNWQKDKLLVNYKLISNIPLPFLTILDIFPYEIEPFKSEINNYLVFAKEHHFFEWDKPAV